MLLNSGLKTMDTKSLKLKIVMWKALIKLVESWSYRCDHEWVKEAETRVFATEDSKLPYKTKYVYRCTKCCDIKKFKG